MANKDLEKVLLAYRDGEKTAEEANKELGELGCGLHIDPTRNVITEAEMAETTISGDLSTINGYVYVDIGVGGYEKVKAIDSVLQGFDAGEMYALAIVGPLYWEIKGDKIGEFKGVLKD